MALTRRFGATNQSGVPAGRATPSSLSLTYTAASFFASSALFFDQD
jgi:hypothetical protein